MKRGPYEFYYTQSPSVRSRLIKLIVRLSGLKKIMELFSSSSVAIDLSGTPHPSSSIKKVAYVQESTENGKTVFTLLPKNNPSGSVVLYLHGGAFTINFTRPHWNFIRDLMIQNQCSIVAPDFPLLPQHDYLERLNMIYAVYQTINQKTDSRNIVLMGDSSGGNMALALAQLLKEKGQNIPSQVILLSPWLDVSMSNPELKTNLPKDPMLPYQGAIKVGKAHAGQSRTDFYQVSPLYGSLKDIGEISLFTGTEDILHPDARKLKGMAKEQQADLNYFQYNGMMHTWMLFDMPESALVKKQISTLLNNSLV